jgi:hypothetical protein
MCWALNIYIELHFSLREFAWVIISSCLGSKQQRITNSAIGSRKPIDPLLILMQYLYKYTREH